jgi:hypothetical protein
MFQNALRLTSIPPVVAPFWMRYLFLIPGVRACFARRRQEQITGLIEIRAHVEDELREAIRNRALEVAVGEPAFLIPGRQLITETGMKELETHAQLGDVFEMVSEVQNGRATEAHFIERFGFASDESFQRCFDYLSSVAPRTAITADLSAVYEWGDWIVVVSFQGTNPIAASLGIWPRPIDAALISPRSSYWKIRPVWLMSGSGYFAETNVAVHG